MDATHTETRILTCSIGIPVYNEQANISRLLEGLIAQEPGCFTIHEIVVIASGCTDNTEDVVKRFKERDRRIRLFVQKERLGKASAVNYFLQQTSADICILESGDTVPCKDTIKNLLKPFTIPDTGMVGGRSVPRDTPENFLGFAVHRLWLLHHKLALKYPKLGELVAFRKAVVTRIPGDTAVDEAAIEALVVRKGYRLCYVPEAVVYNRGPRTVKAYLAQRRRVYTGHLHLKKTAGYAVSSLSNLRIFSLVVRNLEGGFNYFFWMAGAVILEAYARIMGLCDFYIREKNPYIWEVEQDKPPV